MALLERHTAIREAAEHCWSPPTLLTTKRLIIHINNPLSSKVTTLFRTLTAACKVS